MLKQVFRDLDRFCVRENAARREFGGLAMRRFEIKIVGQSALLEEGFHLPLIATHDVDAYANFEYGVMREFERLLAKHGKIFDRNSREIWMPKETKYKTIFRGKFLTGKLAAADFVLLSKARMDPKRNQALLRSYLSHEPSKRFLMLAKKYRVDLERFR